MNNVRMRYQIKKLKDYLALKTGMVNHRDVIREVATGVDRSWVYYLMLLMAALIALFGLLTNSVAVVIGAMLISPLMGPIISSGLALTIGDLPLARRAFRTIAVSVVLTVVVTAAVTLLSPLKEPTAEILARVRPNIYDLFVAMLSGVVGAVALCTKRNYLITATGVAVATAVIPPLSVAGYGLGTGQIMLGLGGFLLFFTNFVAIILTSDLVFFVMGFRSSQVENHQYPQRTRLLFIAGILALVSIPLIYTLVVDLRKLKAKKRIEMVLKKELNQEDLSRMTGFSFQQKKEKVLVRASVNTVKLIDSKTEQAIEEELKSGFVVPVELHLEQVLVASGMLPDNGAVSASALFAEPPRVETPVEIAAKVAGLLARAENNLVSLLVPFPVSDVRLGFGKLNESLLVSASLWRDYPLSKDESLILARQLEQTLELPVKLQIAVVPMLPPLQFTEEGGLDPESLKALAVIKQLPGGVGEYRFLLNHSGKRKGRQVNLLESWLIKEAGVDPASIKVQSLRRKTAGDSVVLRVIRK